VQTVEVRLSGGISTNSTLPVGSPCLAWRVIPTLPIQNELVRTSIVLPEPSTDLPNFFYGLAFREGADNQICCSEWP
jgi:hypothetical protein